MKVIISILIFLACVASVAAHAIESGDPSFISASNTIPIISGINLAIVATIYFIFSFCNSVFNNNRRAFPLKAFFVYILLFQIIFPLHLIWGMSKNFDIIRALGVSAKAIDIDLVEQKRCEVEYPIIGYDPEGNFDFKINAVRLAASPSCEALMVHNIIHNHKCKDQYLVDHGGFIAARKEHNHSCMTARIRDLSGAYSDYRDFSDQSMYEQIKLTKVDECFQDDVLVSSYLCTDAYELRFLRKVAANCAESKSGWIRKPCAKNIAIDHMKELEARYKLR